MQLVEDVNDLDALRTAIKAAQDETERPSMIVVRSHIGFGAPHAVDTAGAHGSPLGEDEVRATKIALGWDPDEHFVVPQDVAEHMNQIERGIALEEDWQKKLSAWSTKYPGPREDWDQVHTGKPRPGWIEALPEFEPGESIATRDAGAKVMEAFKRFTPTMIGGAADLVESTKTEFKGGGVFSATHAGRNIAFGIREHAMGAIVNGISLHDGMLKPYGSTFLIFSDYMRAVRAHLGALEAAVGVGVDARLGRRRRGRADAPAGRALRGAARDPELLVRAPRRRDRDRRRVEGRARARGRPGRACALAPEAADARGHAARGRRARRVRRLGGGRANGLPDLILIATGSEVALAVERRSSSPSRTSRRASSRCRAGSCSRRSPSDYRDEVLPPDVKARLSVEAGVALGWKQWVGDEGDSISIEHFGASAPGNTVLEKFGYTADNVVARALALRARVA